MIDWSLGQALQGFRMEDVSDLAHADDIVILSSSCREMQGLLEVVNHHTAAVGMRLNAWKTKVVSAR